jgi:hypothetical protein
MVLTAGQTTAFFEAADQMAIPHATVLELVNEGIDTVDDLAEFENETIDQIANNLRRPAVAPAAGGHHFVFGAKSQKRLKVACELLRFYLTVGRPLNVANIQWNTVIMNFDIQWKAIKVRIDGDEPETPKIEKGLNIMRWSESFKDVLRQCFGVRRIPLIYVTRDDEAVPAAVPPLAPGQPHSVEAGSVEEELIARASHTHALFREDNALVYFKLEAATRGTAYAASIKPFQRARNGRGALEALLTQFAGDDKWDAEIKKQESLLHTRVWKGQSNYGLEKHCASHRHAYVQLQAASEHIEYQLPNEHSRVGYLIDSIQNNDPGLQAGLANVRSDKGPNGMRGDFEAMVAHILPYCPVSKKRTAGSKRGHADISVTFAEGDTAEVSSFGSKSGVGKSGVHLRFHKHKEYQLLNPEQKSELKDWREKEIAAGRGGKSAGSASKVKSKDKSSEKHINSRIDAAVAKKLAANAKAADDKKSDEAAVDGYIVSAFERLIGKKATPKAPKRQVTLGATNAEKTSILKTILGRAKNQPPQDDEE